MKRFGKPNKRTHRTTGERTARSDFTSLMRSTLLSLLIACLIGLLLLLAASFVLLRTSDPDKYRKVAGLICLYLTAWIGGAIAVKAHGKQSPALCGLLFGLFLLLAMLPVSLCLPDSLAQTQSALAAVGLRLLLPIVSVLSALVSVRNKKRGRPKRISRK